jgi:hypothetical protein
VVSNGGLEKVQCLSGLFLLCATSRRSPVRDAQRALSRNMRDLVLVNMTGSSLLIRLGTCSSRASVIAVIGGSVVRCKRS